MPRRSIRRFSVPPSVGSSRGFTLRMWPTNGQVLPLGSAIGGGNALDAFVPSFSVTTGVGLEKRKLLLLKSSSASCVSSVAGARITGAPDGQRPTRREAKDSRVIGCPDATLAFWAPFSQNRQKRCT